MQVDTSAPVVLFDGECNLCNHSVNFVIDRDPRGHFRFASSQSDVGQALLARHGLRDAALTGVVLLQDGRAFTGSSAALRIARGLRAPWSLLSWLLVVPRPIRDFVYGVVARNRYRWFGRIDACRLPTPELRQRFLDLER
jgi:predicted DCC family thiol-disulfide oxidoreductase YuxK